MSVQCFLGFFLCPCLHAVMIQDVCIYDGYHVTSDTGSASHISVSSSKEKSIKKGRTDFCLSKKLSEICKYMELNFCYAFMKYLGKRRGRQNLVCENSSKWPQIAHLPKNKQRYLPSLYFNLSLFLLSTNDVILKKDMTQL